MRKKYNGNSYIINLVYENSDYLKFIPKLISPEVFLWNNVSMV